MTWQCRQKAKEHDLAAFTRTCRSVTPARWIATHLWHSRTAMLPHPPKNTRQAELLLSFCSGVFAPCTRGRTQSARGAGQGLARRAGHKISETKIQQEFSLQDWRSSGRGTLSATVLQRLWTREQEALQKGEPLKTHPSKQSSLYTRRKIQDVAVPRASLAESLAPSWETCARSGTVSQQFTLMDTSGPPGPSGQWHF